MPPVVCKDSCLQALSATIHSVRSGGRAQLAALRSRDTSRKDRTHQRAVKNWHRAQAAVSRKLTAEMLGTQRK